MNAFGAWMLMSLVVFLLIVAFVRELQIDRYKERCQQYEETLYRHRQEELRFQQTGGQITQAYDYAHRIVDDVANHWR